MSPSAYRETRKNRPSPKPRLSSRERKTYTRKPALPPPSQPKEWITYANNMFESYNKKHPNSPLQLTSSGKIKGGNGSTIKNKSSISLINHNLSAKKIKVNSKSKKSR